MPHEKHERHVATICGRFERARARRRRRRGGDRDEERDQLELGTAGRGTERDARRLQRC